MFFHGWVDYSGLPLELSSHGDFELVWCSDVFISGFIFTVICPERQIIDSMYLY